MDALILLIPESVLEFDAEQQQVEHSAKSAFNQANASELQRLINKKNDNPNEYQTID